VRGQRRVTAIIVLTDFNYVIYQINESPIFSKDRATDSGWFWSGLKRLTKDKKMGDDSTESGAGARAVGMDTDSGARVRTVVVVGGGSAGWLAAARIAARNGTAGHDGVRVVLVESARIGTIGVGEGTWPTMRATLRKIGIGETEFLRSCDAAFKQGAKFIGWTDGSAADGYYHPLNPPQGALQINLSGHWQQLRAEGGPEFADAVDFQAALCEAGLAPKAITTPEYAAVANYAYHLDAGKFAELLRSFSVTRLGVEHIVDDVVDVALDAGGDIGTLRLKERGEMAGDLFIDCTGFAALLIGKVYKVPFRDCGDTLFADRALAVQVPYACEDAPVACHTIATAQANGWIWDIGLPTRRGVGHVYSSRHTSDDEAERALRRYVGPAANGLDVRQIKIRAGHRTAFWQNNCVAVGLSAGFLEPLEASALMLIETAIDIIADRLPANRAVMEVVAAQFNRAFSHHWERIIEFLKLHYVLTKRDDTAFWRDNRDPASIPPDLVERLRLWRHQPPSTHDFPHSPEVFSWPSYQYILHGMRFETDYDGPAQRAEMMTARRWFSMAEQVRQKTLAELPRHRDLLNRVRDFGLQPV
jgi:tryptophan halogenase